MRPRASAAGERVPQHHPLGGVRIRGAQLLLAIRDQLRDALLVGAVGGEGDEFLFGVVCELEYDVLQVQVAEDGMAQCMSVSAVTWPLPSSPPQPRVAAVRSRGGVPTKLCGCAT